VANIKATFQDPDFLGLPEEEQIKVLQKLDKEFATFPKNIQLEIIKKGTTVPVPSERKTLGTFVGGVVGGLLGLRGGLTGTTAGSGVGGAIGKRIDQLREKESVMKPYGVEDITPTGEELTEMVKAGTEEAAFELGGGLIFKGARRVLAPFKGSIDSTAKELNNYLAKRMKAKGFDMGLLPSEMAGGDNWFLQLYQNISEGALLGGGQMKRFKAARSEVLAEIADEIVESYGRNAKITDISEMFIGHIKGKQSYHQAISNALYNSVSERAKGVMVSMADIKGHSGELRKIAEEINKIGGDTAGYDLLGKIATLPDKISFEAAKELRTNLMAASDIFKAQSKKAGGVGLTKHYTKIIDDSIEKALGKNPGALSAWRQANEFHKTWKGRFDNTVIRRLIHYADETGKGAAFIAPDAMKNPETVLRVKQALGEGSKEWKVFQGFYIQDLFRKSADVETMREVIKHGKVTKEALITGKNMLKQMYGDSLKAETFNTVFNPTQARRINRFADALMVAQKKESQGIGKMWIQLTQGGAIMGFASGLAPEAAGLVIGPGLMAKLLTTKSGNQLLTEGIATLKGDPRIAGLSARILKHVIQLGNEEEKKRKAEAKKEEFVYGPEWG